MKLIKRKELNHDTIQDIMNTCVCQQYSCSHGCSFTKGVYDAYNDFYYASKRLSIRGDEPMNNLINK